MSKHVNHLGFSRKCLAWEHQLQIPKELIQRYNLDIIPSPEPILFEQRVLLYRQSLPTHSRKFGLFGKSVPTTKKDSISF